jgi:amino acid transporter
MAAGWDGLAPRWFTRLHPVRRTPVNSILFVAALVMLFILMSMLGVREQEASQLLQVSSVAHYSIAYIGLFAIPVFGRLPGPGWLKPVAWAGLLASIVALFFAIYPIVEVESKAAFAGKIGLLVTLANLTGFAIYRLDKNVK